MHDHRAHATAATQSGTHSLTPSSAEGAAKSLTSRPDGLAPGIDGLIQLFLGMYGARFSDAYRGVDHQVLRAVWRDGLRGYTAQELDRGIAACKTRPFPPTLPEFLALCRPPIDPEQAYYEAVEQMAAREHRRDQWTAPAIFHAAARFGGDLGTKPFHQQRARWEVALRACIADVEAGRLPAEVPPRPLALPNEHKPTPMPPHLRDLLARAASAMTTKGPTDHAA